ncbi:hypothetical protein ATSB10_14560 [Dyella thiooxydans]|uniref:Alginate export domain-containing protein n=1 Tax=Dyella thiooxydans TaxID=445710 RepID=A0A160MZY5_9GAMM|nr:alginate export family protein [Dyella thiooxydans]AND68910.1 hypothetical protein ATSB10_14560 [Dyella thiooxydans]
MKPWAVNAPRAAFVLLLGAAGCANAQADTASGPQLDVRYRLEQVDQGGFARDANASTVRTRLGYRFADHSGWSALVSLQDNRVVGNDLYNSTRNGQTNYPVVSDPADTELDQAYVEYHGWQPLDLRVGRQVIKLDNDRFVGNVGFRQLEQSFDAVRAIWTPSSAWRVDYAWLTRVNRIFGAHHPDPLHARQNLDTHLLNVSWKQAAGTVVGYAYLIGNQSLPASSHRDLGLRWLGHAARGQDWSIDYTLEAARQHAWKRGTLQGSRSYLHAEVALGLRAWQWTLGQERLQGDGTSALQTPLATLHAFNGWADRFLATPADGLADSYLGVSWKARTLSVAATAHHFAATHTGTHYGDELDLSAGLAIDRHFSTSLALADYRADHYATDTRIVWFSVEYKL